MEDSILISTKKILDVSDTYTAFDLDILTHINASFSILSQLGLGPADGFMIEDDVATWQDFMSDGNELSLVRTYVFLKTSLLFDPPTTSFMIKAVTDQIQEYEWRLNVLREEKVQ